MVSVAPRLGSHGNTSAWSQDRSMSTLTAARDEKGVRGAPLLFTLRSEDGRACASTPQHRATKRLSVPRKQDRRRRVDNDNRKPRMYPRRCIPVHCWLGTSRWPLPPPLSRRLHDKQAAGHCAPSAWLHQSSPNCPGLPMIQHQAAADLQLETDCANRRKAAGVQGERQLGERLTASSSWNAEEKLLTCCSASA